MMFMDFSIKQPLLSVLIGIIHCHGWLPEGVSDRAKGATWSKCPGHMGYDGLPPQKGTSQEGYSWLNPSISQVVVSYYI